MTKPRNTNRLQELDRLNRREMSDLWRELFKNEPRTEVRRDLMLRFVAQRMQEQEFGGLREASSRRLRQLATAVAADPKAPISVKAPIKSGTRMVRQWKDQVHVVNVEGRQFEYRGKHYESLSEIARLITGTRWSGPLFFGVTSK
jgi:hypothetical protein